MPPLSTFWNLGDALSKKAIAGDTSLLEPWGTIKTIAIFAVPTTSRTWAGDEQTPPPTNTDFNTAEPPLLGRAFKAVMEPIHREVSPKLSTASHSSPSSRPTQDKKLTANYSIAGTFIGLVVIIIVVAVLHFTRPWRGWRRCGRERGATPPGRQPVGAGPGAGADAGAFHDGANDDINMDTLSKATTVVPPSDPDEENHTENTTAASTLAPTSVSSISAPALAPAEKPNSATPLIDGSCVQMAANRAIGDMIFPKLRNGNGHSDGIHGDDKKTKTAEPAIQILDGSGASLPHVHAPLTWKKSQDQDGKAPLIMLMARDTGNVEYPHPVHHVRSGTHEKAFHASSHAMECAA